jgi:hypothetical protein
MGNVYSIQRMRENKIALEIIQEINKSYSRLVAEIVPAGDALLQRPELRHLSDQDCLIIIFPDRDPSVVPRYEWKNFLDKLKAPPYQPTKKQPGLMTLLMYKSLSQVLEHIFLK